MEVGSIFIDVSYLGNIDGDSVLLASGFDFGGPGVIEKVIILFCIVVIRIVVHEC